MLSNKITDYPLIHGLMRVQNLSAEDLEKLINYELKEGIEVLDTADIYGRGKSEELIGEILKKNPSLRGKIYIQTKVGIVKGDEPRYDFSYEYIKKGVEASLERLNCQYVDMLILHRPDALMEPEEVGRAINELYDEGKIRHFGVSNMNPYQMELIASAVKLPIEVNQLQFGLMHTGLIDAGLKVNNHMEEAISYDLGTLDYCRLHHITPQAWSPFIVGFFEDSFVNNPKYLELNKELEILALKNGVSKHAVAVAWILRHPAHFQVVYGSMNEQHIADILVARNVKLSKEEWYRLYRAAGHVII